MSTRRRQAARLESRVFDLVSAALGIWLILSRASLLPCVLLSALSTATPFVFSSRLRETSRVFARPWDILLIFGFQGAILVPFVSSFSAAESVRASVAVALMLVCRILVRPGRE